MSTSSPPSNTTPSIQMDSRNSPRLPNGALSTFSAQSSSSLPDGVIPTSSAQSSPRLPSRAIAPSSTDETLTSDRQYSSVNPYDDGAAMCSTPPLPFHRHRGESTDVSDGESQEPDWEGERPDTPTPSAPGDNQDHISALGYDTEGHHEEDSAMGMESPGTEDQSGEERERSEAGQSET